MTELYKVLWINQSEEIYFIPPSGIQSHNKFYTIVYLFYSVLVFDVTTATEIYHMWKFQLSYY